ncbi:homoserine dehydrogenase [Fictibacillus sp. Mic-4]|uniref:homoserine dehydrogenase n=1 Tax=Fictibacillus sp. Mic-4 TaxID=3132826 RepID=UPI003CE9BA49
MNEKNGENKGIEKQIIKVALLGLGTVGYGVFTGLVEKKGHFSSLLGKAVEITGILIQDPTKNRELPKDVFVTTNFQELLQKDKPDVVVEAIGGKEPAFTFIRQSLESGCHVISANKDLIARSGKELLQIAQSNDVRFVYEASVGGGIPVLRTIKELLQVNRIERVEAILNGTTNFILSYMRNHRSSFYEALEIARQQGYAEADPTNDIEGIDAFYKAMVLCDWVFGEQPDWDHVQVKGIKDVQTEELLLAEQSGLRLKQLVTINETLDVQVTPIFVDQEHPLYGVEGVDNAVRIKTDLLGYLTLQGAGAGAFPTASAILEDLISVYKTTNKEKVKTGKREEKRKESKESNVFALFIKNVLNEKEFSDIVKKIESSVDLLHASGEIENGNAFVLVKGNLESNCIGHEFSVYPVQITNEQMFTRVKEKAVV